MSSFNRVILLGNTTRDPELKYTPGGTAVCELGLAVNDKRKGQTGEWIEETTFVDVTLWGRTAEIASEYLSKGSPVLIEGRLKLEQWEDRNGGGKRSKLKVVGEKLQLLGGRGGDGSNSGQRSQGNRQPAGQGSRSSYGGNQGRQHDTYSEPPGDEIPF